MSDMTERAFSATGKAILAGGYLVLDPKYKAFVIALSARMHALNKISDANRKSGSYNITVTSPQFSNGSWSYDIDVKDIIDKGLLYQLSELNGRFNPFVEATILITINYAISSGVINENSNAKNIKITMFSDAEYHSQINSTEKVSTNKSMKFLYHKNEITKVSKTGLGSSAGLVTSLTASLLSSLFSNFDINNSSLKWKEKVHNLSQIAHCKAQGKIGSGFDVASATFGSIIYQRFSPQLINTLLESKSETLSKLLYLVDEQEWSMKHDLCGMPPGICLLMGDVMGGSETPKLVTKVQNWRKEKPEYSNKVWTELDASNMRLVKALQSLNDLYKSDNEKYNHILTELNMNSGDSIMSNSSSNELKEIVESIISIRKYLKIMTHETGAEIEPDEQTELLDNVRTITGVLGGVVPGAGGYDAICALVASSTVQDIISTTAVDHRFDTVRWMDLNEQKDGLIEESYSDFEGLL